ncbi:MAG: DUF4375 domain-containing protein [Oscillospiraceae bacterium]|nr:DUF4375 domain-containing protein [Oscillospiraceae bacterium]
MKLKIFSSKKEISDEAKIWNDFVSRAAENDVDDLSGFEKTAALVFWYDAEVNNGGHSAYFDCFENVDPEELISALKEIGAGEYADIFSLALLSGEDDDYSEADERFGEKESSLAELLMKYVISNNK